MKKILVTGGLGYIGSHTVVALQEKGYEVVIVDNLANSQLEILDRINKISGIKPIFEQLDLRSKSAVISLFEKYTDISGIIHFAAFKAVGESVAKPLDYYENNLNTLIYLLQQVEIKKIPFIFSSSCTVYGEAEQMPIFENAPVQPAISPYGNTKQIGEEIVLDVAKSTEIKAILLRYFNPIGAHKVV
jgi:UDP-glucose 4-epimerase